MDTTLLFKLIGISAAACCGVMALVWLWAWKIKNAGVVDIFWAFNFTIICGIIWYFADGFEMRKNLICLMGALWSARLGIYLLIRVGSHLKEEEGRYKQLRKEWAPNPDMKFFFFFQMQALSNVFLSIPFFIAAINPEPQLTVIEYAAAGLWAIALLGETIADWQLKAFKNNPANKGKVCDKGLWNYSRHPNYFFEWLIWMAYFFFAVASPWGWISFVCPLVIFLLIFRVTGIPMTEEQAVRSKGEAYKEYQRTTSVFVPWFKKK